MTVVDLSLNIIHSFQKELKEKGKKIDSCKSLYPEFLLHP